MCRLYAFCGSEATRLDCALVRAQNALIVQSRADRRGLPNVDGWGIGFYDDGRPEVTKRSTPALEDVSFVRVAERVRAHTVVAHVRRATVGGARLANTHPFRLGTWLFAHNGTLTAFGRLSRQLEAETRADFLKQRDGTTDSELIFLWLMSRLASSGIGPRAIIPWRTRASKSTTCRRGRCRRGGPGGLAPACRSRAGRPR